MENLFVCALALFFAVVITFFYITEEELKRYGTPGLTKDVPLHDVAIFFWWGLKRRIKSLSQHSITRRFIANTKLHLPFAILPAFPPPLLPLDKIVLKLRRSQKQSRFLARPIFVLDARIDAPDYIKQYIRFYRLRSRLVYDSPNRQRRSERTVEHAENIRHAARLLDPPLEQFKSFLWMIWRFFLALFSLGLTYFALRITIRKLFRGVHVESRSLEELLDTEQDIKDAVEGLKNYLAIAGTFTGQEELVEL